jgi:hypothetical protein
MNGKIALVLLVAAVLLGSLSCRREKDTQKQTTTTKRTEPNAAQAQPPTSVGGQQPGTGTAQQPGAGTAQKPGAGTAQQPPAGGTQPPARVGETEPNKTTPASAQVPSSQKPGTK